jgi:hypothetical protein
MHHHPVHSQDEILTAVYFNPTTTCCSSNTARRHCHEPPKLPAWRTMLTMNTASPMLPRTIPQLHHFSCTMPHCIAGTAMCIRKGKKERKLKLQSGMSPRIAIEVTQPPTSLFDLIPTIYAIYIPQHIYKHTQNEL